MAVKIAAHLKTRSGATIVFNLTMVEAVAMSRALGNSTDCPDAMEALFDTVYGRKAAYRAHTKLDRAIFTGMAVSKRKKK